MSEQIETPRNEHAAGGISPQLRELLHRHEQLCTELELLPQSAAGDYAAELDRLTEAYRALPALPPEYAEILERRFSDAVDAAHRAAAAAEERRRQLQERCELAGKLSGELDQLAAAGELLTLDEVRNLERRWNECVKDLPAGMVDLDSFTARLTPLREKLEAEAAADAVRSEQVLKLAAELTELAAGEDMELLRERKAAIEAEFAAIERVPKAAADRYNDAHRKAAARLGQHYETLDLARWESYTHKLDLCAELDKLAVVEDAELPKAARRLQEIREKWKTLGAVPKVKADEINPRYLELTRALQHRVDEHFAHLRQLHKQAAAEKQQMVDKAAAMADSTEWNATAAAFKELQAQWKNVPHAGAAEKGLYTAFRAAADRFFNARSAYFAERNRRFDEIAERKLALIAEAEALTDHSAETVRRAKQLRSDFQAAGPAGRREPELTGRFNAALDKFFSGRREEFAERERKSRELVAELEALAADPKEPGATEARAREIRARLRELACRNTYELEQQAFEKLDRSLGALRKRALTDKLALLRETARAAAALVDRFRAGGAIAPEEIGIDHAGLFSKLNAGLQLLPAASSGDAKAKERLEKLLHQAEKEHDRICSALEKLVGVEPPAAEKADDAASLAAELTAAIAGNFAAGAVKAQEKPVDPKQLLAEYLNAGLLGSAALEESLERFDRAYGQLR